jgi:hypothetical protein
MSLFELRSEPGVAASRSPRRPAGVAVVDRRGPTGGGTPWGTLVAIALLAAAGLAMVAGPAVVNGDAVWHLIWGRQLAEGTATTFATGPTPHPSLLGLAVATSALGDTGSYLVTYAIFGPLAFGALLAAVFDVARRLSSRWAAALALLILSTSVGVLSLAGAARYDIAFAALVMTAVALEMARPRRGVAPLACAAAAGLIRPEAWVLAGIYWLWVAPGLSWSGRMRTAVLVAVAPVLWASMDLLVMGDALYSFHVTDQGSEVLYGQYTTWENLQAAGRNVVWYMGVFPLLLLVPALVLLVSDRPRSALPPLGALAITLGIFLLLLSQGMASNERYLLVPACVLAILAAVAVDGGGRRTRARVVLGAFLTVILALQLASRTDVYGAVQTRSANAHGWYESTRALVEHPGVREALRRCPSVSLAGHKMRPSFAFHSGRAPAAFLVDGKGRAQTDLFIAPGNPAAAKMALTRPRFDDDASFRVPAGLRQGPRNADWVLYASPTSSCASGLR